MASVRRRQNMDIKVPASLTLKVGFFAGATYPEGQSVPEVAAFNEFGTLRSPPRPFFRNMLAARKGEWGPQTAELLRDNDMDTARAADIMGQNVVGQLAQSINEFDSVPLAASTIQRKGFAKQLVDTALMLRSIGYRVVEE